MKSEKPTPKRLLKESQKGTSYRSRDLTVAAILVAGVLTLLHATSFEGIRALFTVVIGRNFDVQPGEIAILAVKAFGSAVAPVLVVAIVSVALVSLLQSRGVLAVEAIRIDFSRLDPIKGLKNLVSVKVIKNVLSASLYALLGFAFLWVAWHIWGSRVFAQAHVQVAAGSWAVHRISMDVVLALLGTLAPLVFLAALLEFRLYIRELRMDKSEVKQEHKDNDGNPEIKQNRKQLAVELSAQVQADVAGSSAILANPTHIAVGIYAHDGVSWPMVSVHEKGERALAVIKLAEQLGVPVIRDIPLARGVYFNTRRYQFVPEGQLEAVLRLLQWLRDVERAGVPDPDDPSAVEET
ncbi:EscU/YscU/HrcU family type III secretion system export apparatus switch protein [Pseudoxanthomonas sp. UTMC 1351]|uniref:EscU/YscU/HrcU family type III secretion system export apparatus switch protein n=1 Tax=Pseudoxanthomonas sp. UTMC 1351 TaxID=2695853 RepID=UPI0034CE77D2